MSQPWGRDDAAGTWPNKKPVWTLAALLVALASGVAIGVSRYRTTWTPLQRVYLSTYVRSTLAAALATRGRYDLLEVAGRTNLKSRLALDEEVRPVTTASGETTFALSQIGVHAGAHHLAWQRVFYDHAALHRLLGHWIYADQTLVDLAMPAMWTALGVFGVGLLIAIPKDAARARARRHGRRLKGPELVTAAQFNRRTRADGVGFPQTSGVLARWFLPPPWVRLPRRIEASHLLIMGDSGAGKSALIRQILRQLEARGDAAIVYDPALDYTPQFYDAARGDVILNPLDARSPYWTPGDELRHEAEALTVATSLFPDRDHENRFFTDAPRRIFAHLLTFHPSPKELGAWLCHPEELDKRLVGTPYATMIDRDAPDQRTGVRSSLNMVADALALLPAERDTTRRWSALAWAQARQGWLFLTSTPETRERLRPLTSLWLDLLVLRLMNPGQPGRRPVWFVLDELASLQRLPQLHTAVTENRKSNNPVVLGFQGRSQLETRYGHDAEAMLSQPATKIFLKTSEAHAAKWIADTIGDIEIERVKESRSHGPGPQTSYGLERQVEPLVMASEITGLVELRGFLKLGNLVVRLSFPFLDLPTRAPSLIERPALLRGTVESLAGGVAPGPIGTPTHPLAPAGPGHHFR